MSEGRFVWSMIKSLMLIFLIVVVFTAGSIVANELINSQDSAVIPFGFGLYLIVGIVEILLGYFFYRTWKSR